MTTSKNPLFQQFPPIDFDLRQLEIFCKVVDLGSFSKAARAVFLAQASVSERVGTLEGLVGVRLLDRLGRQVVPTKAGEILYKHAAKLLEMKKSACVELEAFLGLKQGNIHIGGSTIPGEYILPRVIGAFQKKFPLASVNLTIADTGKIENLALDGALELGIVGSKSSNNNFICHKLWKDELVLAVPARHRWAERGEVSIKEICEEPFLLRETGSGTRLIMENYLKARLKKDLGVLNVVACLGTSTAVKEGIKAGLGVSILSLRALDMELQAGILKVLKIKDLRISRNFYLIRDKRRTASPICKAMFDFLLASFKEKIDKGHD